MMQRMANGTSSASAASVTSSAASISPASRVSGTAASAAVADDAAAGRLSASLLFAYALPRAGIGLVGVAVATYLAKYATDVLLIAPGAMALIHAVSRVWDGVTDPLVGHASDRTRARIGRRRIWMFASAIPLWLSVMLLWSPPESMFGLGMVVWLTLGYLLYESAQTLFLIPYQALGVELTYDYHERTRLFAWQHVGLIAGTLLGLVVLSQFTSSPDPRALAWTFACTAGGLLALSIVFAALRLPERAENQGRPGRDLFRSMADVFRNPHGRRLLFVYGIDRLGGACVMALVPYVAQYMLGDENYFERILLAYLAPQFLLTPLWLRVAGAWEKKRLWQFSMWVTFAGFCIQFFYTPDTPGLVIYAVTFGLGVAASIGAVCALAMKADVIDYDEYQTGERKEGSYIAVWNLVQKVGSAIPPFLTLSLMEYFGYRANQEQNEATLWVMRSAYSIVPAICFAIGIAMFARFSFNLQEHQRVRELIDARRT